MKIKYLAFVTLLLILVGCSDKIISLNGESEHWKVVVTNRFQTGMVEYTLRYIGDENMVKDVGYQFGGKDLTASGLEENLGTPFRDIKHTSGPKYLENEDFPIPVHIQWNEDQEETVYLQKL
ncbi:hypothetical protein HP548_26875 [Paenibacillus taichungensis]|uniref:Lipoprotein n=1 Tax=Paenibacillus taichungensis TaxID=484184 RepID=A0ABX2MUF4_9BACL|nr:hypothetical protein [Paenibacillus taichungensis]NUU57713.1 hypothetical protein [Paenibacillus taichungensis]